MSYLDESGRLVPQLGKNGGAFVIVVDENGNPTGGGGGGGGGGSDGPVPDFTTPVMEFTAQSNSPDIDASGYGAGTLQIIQSGGTLVVEGSNDGTTWTGITLSPVGSTGNSADTVSAVGAVGMWRFDASCKVLRVRAASVNSGQTVRALVNLVASSFSPRSIYINGMAGNLFTGVKLAVQATDSASQIGSVYRLPSSAASTNAALVKSGATRALSVRAFNGSEAVAYLKLFNKSSAPVTGTDNPVITIPLPTGVAAEWNLLPYGLHFAAGLGIAITTGPADDDNTALDEGDVTGLSVVYA